MTPTKRYLLRKIGAVLGAIGGVWLGLALGWTDYWLFALVAVCAFLTSFVIESLIAQNETRGQD